MEKPSPIQTKMLEQFLKMIHLIQLKDRKKENIYHLTVLEQRTQCVRKENKCSITVALAYACPLYGRFHL